MINFAALTVYTRLLTAEDFGRYALIISTVNLIYALIFQWLTLVLGRFIPAYLKEPEIVLQPILGLYLCLAALTVCFGLLGTICFSEAVWIEVTWLTVALAALHAWHEINLAVCRAQLAPAKYALLGGIKVTVAFIVGGGLAWQGLGTKSPVLGLVAGTLVAWLSVGRSSWSHVKPCWPNVSVLKNFASYGLPLAASFALVWITSSSDRYLIAWLLDEKATGGYAVGYDLAQQSLGLVLAIANTAATPLVMRSLEQEGVESARQQLSHNGQLIFVLALGGAAGLIAVGPTLIEVFIGREFWSDAGTILPWVAILAAIVGVKSFHFDMAFHLSKRPSWLIVNSGLAAIATVLLNLLLIPRYGIVGAAWSGITAFIIATVCSWRRGKDVFSMPKVIPLLWRAGVVAGAIYVGASWFAPASLAGAPKLVVSLLGGGLSGLIGAYATDIAGLRRIIMARISKNT